MQKAVSHISGQHLSALHLTQNVPSAPDLPHPAGSPLGQDGNAAPNLSDPRASNKLLRHPSGRSESNEAPAVVWEPWDPSTTSPGRGAEEMLGHLTPFPLSIHVAEESSVTESQSTNLTVLLRKCCLQSHSWPS